MRLPRFFRQPLQGLSRYEANPKQGSAALALSRLQRELSGLNQVHFGPKGGLYRLGRNGQKIYLKKSERLAA